MKKTILLLAPILLVFCDLNAQESKGNYSFEFNVDPAALFDANAGSMFQMPNLKGRYFLAPDLAARFGVGFGFSSNKNFTDTDGDYYTKNTSVNVSLYPGIEKHLGTGKFEGYIGTDLGLIFNSEKYKQVTAADETITKNPNGLGYLGIGLNAVAGFDYYIFNNVFIGAEFSPGLMFRKYTDTVMDDVITNKGGTGFNFYLSSSSGIRMGIRF